MKDSKYLTIDPLILQTLNLNQQRMKHILTIIRGNEHQQANKTQRKTINRSFNKYQTLSSTNQQESALPTILSTTRKNNQSTKNQLGFNSPAKIKAMRSINQIEFIQSNSSNAQADKMEKTKIKINRYERSPQSQKISKNERSVQEEALNLQQQIIALHEDKKLQLMKDYMTNKLRRSKSQQINPKDLYRFQIENIIAEHTAIEQLQQAEHRMRRLKRKHRHLASFDKNYYIKLNQHDMLILF